MPYSDNDNLLNAMDSSELARITGGSEIDYDKVDFARQNADAVIDAYLLGRYDIDEENIPVLIRKISVDLTLVNLFENYHNFGDIPNTIIRKKRDSISALRDIALSKISIAATNSDSIIFIKNSVTNNEY